MTRSTNADKWEQRRATRDSPWAFLFAHPFIRGQAWHIYPGRLLDLWVPRQCLSACLFTSWQQPGGEELFAYCHSLGGIFIFLGRRYNFRKYSHHSSSIFLKSAEGVRLYFRLRKLNSPRSRIRVIFPGPYTGFWRMLPTGANWWLLQPWKGNFPHMQLCKHHAGTACQV